MTCPSEHAQIFPPGVFAPLSSGHLALVLFDLTRWANIAHPDNVAKLPAIEHEDFVGMLKTFPEPSRNHGAVHSNQLAIINGAATIENELLTHGYSVQRKDGVPTAFIHSLKQKVGKEVAPYLPSLPKLILREVLNCLAWGWLPLRLLIGYVCHEQTDRRCRLWVYFEKSKQEKSAPSFRLIRSGPVTPSDDDDTDSEDDDRLEWKFAKLINEINDRKVQLSPIFRPLRHHELELIALAKYCFVLASESSAFTKFDHEMPLNANFEVKLQKACELIRNRKDESRNDIGIMDFPLHRFGGLDGRRTQNSKDAADDVKKTGLKSLDDLPTGDLELLDSLDNCSPGPGEKVAKPMLPARDHGPTFPSTSGSKLAGEKNRGAIEEVSTPLSNPLAQPSMQKMT